MFSSFTNNLVAVYSNSNDIVHRSNFESSIAHQHSPFVHFDKPPSNPIESSIFCIFGLSRDLVLQVDDARVRQASTRACSLWQHVYSDNSDGIYANGHPQSRNPSAKRISPFCSQHHNHLLQKQWRSQSVGA